MAENGINPKVMASFFKGGVYEKSVIVYGQISDEDAISKAFHSLGIAKSSFGLPKHLGDKTEVRESESGDSVLVVNLESFRS